MSDWVQWIKYVFFSAVADDVNLALGRPASQSSQLGSYQASNAVDGNAVNDTSFSITSDMDNQPWWKVELANVSWVTHVELTNRYNAGEYE